MKQLLCCLVVAGLLNIAAGTICSCPLSCECTTIGTSGITAECTTLSSEQTFCDSIQHLKISNSENEIALGPNFFKNVGLSKVESIKIVNSSLSTIDVDAFKGLKNLLHLNLADNGLILIHPDMFVSNIELRTLELSGNPLQLTQVLEPSRKYLIKSESLHELKLSRCQLRSLLPDTFNRLPNLMMLDLSSNFLSQITSDIFRPTQFIEDLNLSNNLIREIDPDTFSNLTQLMDLNLKNNSLISFNRVVINDLSSLDLSHNKLSIVTDSTFQEIEGLEILNLSHNKITDLSKNAFSKCTSLRHLDVSWNLLSKPLDFQLFNNNFDLEALKITGNKIGNLSIPRGFTGKHLMLTELDASHCDLQFITKNDFEGMDNLKELKLSHNDLSFLSIAEGASLSNLKSLKILDLSFNQIEDFGELSFNENRQLTNLNLAGNSLTDLPVRVFSNLTSLKYLDVSNNQLFRLWDRNVPSGHSAPFLPKLAYFNVSHNKLQTLHVHDFKSLTNLETVELYENPLKCTSAFTSLSEFFDEKFINPSVPTPELMEYLSKDIHNKLGKTLRWNSIVRKVCRLYENDAHLPKNKEIEKEKDAAKIPFELESSNIPMSAIQADAELSDVIDDEDFDVDSLFEKRLFWRMYVLGIIIVASMVFAFVWAVQKRRKMAVQKAFFGSMGGHIIKTKNGGGSLYYKLYEECSVPNQPAVHSPFPFAKFQIPSLVSDYKKVKLVKTIDDV